MLFIYVAFSPRAAQKTTSRSRNSQAAVKVKPSDMDEETWNLIQLIQMEDMLNG